MSLPVRWYTGVGSRETPTEKIRELKFLAHRLWMMGYGCRTGDATGADGAFRAVIINSNFLDVVRLGENTPESDEIALANHQAPQYARKYLKAIGRNPIQVLGRDLQSPSDFVLCWTKDGKDVGGTGTTIRIAQSYNVPVFNLATCTTKDVLLFANKNRLLPVRHGQVHENSSWPL